MNTVSIFFSLILGIVASGLAFDAFRHHSTNLLTPSWICCAVALLFPLLMLEQLIRKEDWSALMDTIHALSLCSRVLLLGNGLMSVLVLIRSRKH